MRQRRKRRFFTATESAEIWDRWCRGEGLKSIGRGFRKNSSSIFAHIRHGHSLRRIASSLERAPSTVSREIARNATTGVFKRNDLGHVPGTRRFKLLFANLLNT